MATQLILASASPRRATLLAQIGIIPDQIIPTDTDESRHKNEAPHLYVKRLAGEKAAKIAASHPDDFILAADTAVVSGGKILPKAETPQDVATCLERLSGRAHKVLTAIFLHYNGKTASRLVTTRVSFKRLHREDITAYLASKEGIGKAGGYAIQGKAGAFVKNINGSYSAVVGLPLYETQSLLRGSGYGLSNL